MAALLRFGFETLGLHRVWGYCLAANEASWRVMERLGMQREGLLRENEYLQGRWWDTAVYGLLASEWRQRSA
jgi:RimJ/RimL family protein N-acetyltransferase